MAFDAEEDYNCLINQSIIRENTSATCEKNSTLEHKAQCRHLLHSVPHTLTTVLLIDANCNT